MSVSAGALGTGLLSVALGAMLVLVGAGLLLNGPVAWAEEERDAGLLGLGASSRSAAAVNPLPILGLVLAALGAPILLFGLRGTLGSFEAGKERDEGSLHRVVVEHK